MSPTSPLRSKLFWVGVLYFAEGFPLGVFYEILPVHFRQQGVNLSEIGFLSLLGLAWSIKFLWAPLIDRFRHHRTWMMVVDLGMAAMLLSLAAMNEFGPWVWVAVGCFTLLSATNDIAIDGYTIEYLNRNEFGIANGVRIGLYRIGMISTGFLLMLQPWLGWSGVYTGGALVMVAMAAACRAAPKEQPAGERPNVTALEELRSIATHPAVFAPALLLIAALIALMSPAALRLAGADALAEHGPTAAAVLLAAAVVIAVANRRRRGEAIEFEARGPMLGAFIAIVSRRYFFPVLLFILTFKLADQTIGFMIKPFWVDAGFSARQIGLVSVNIGLALSIAGGLAGGWFTDRFGVFTGLWVLGLTQIFSNLGYAWIAHVFALPGVEIQHEPWQYVAMYSASAVESFTQGLGTGAFMAFLMAIVDKRNAATEFAILSSMFVLARSVAGWAGGYGAEAWGYGTFFLATFFFGLPAYLLLPWARAMLRDSEQRDTRAAQSSR